MKTMLIPVDFTATSENSINFAAEWSERYGYERIILLKSYYDSVFETVVVSEGYANVNEESLNTERANAKEQLDEWCHSLAAKMPGKKVMTALSEMPLLRAVAELLH